MSLEDHVAKHNLRPYLEAIDPMWAHLNQFDYHAAIDVVERVRAMVLEEREACAKIADKWATDLQRQLGNGGPAAEIRNRR
jgi:hypothetical protein